MILGLINLSLAVIVGASLHVSGAFAAPLAGTASPVAAAPVSATESPAAAPVSAVTAASVMPLDVAPLARATEPVSATTNPLAAAPVAAAPVAGAIRLAAATPATTETARAFSLPELQQQLQGAGAVHGDFEQLRYLRALPTPLKSSGRFDVTPGESLLWHVQKPFEQRVRVDAEGVKHWDGKRWQADKKSGSAGRTQMRFFMDLVSGRFESLQQHFSLKLTGKPEDWALKLTPASALMKQIFSGIDIQGDAFVRTVVLHEAQGDRVELRFQNLSHGAGNKADADNAGTEQAGSDKPAGTGSAADKAGANAPSENARGATARDAATSSASRP